MRLTVLPLLLALPFAVPAQTSPVLAPRQLFEARRFDEARAAFQAELSRNKNDAVALYYMGRIADAQDKSGEAVDRFEKAVKPDEKNALYHFWLGSALGDEAQKASKFRQPFLARRVKSEFERAVALDPRMLDARFGLVDFYSIAPGIMGGSMSMAREHAAAIGALNPVRGHLAFARIALREKNDSAAIREYEAAIAAAPDSIPAYYGLAGFYRNRSHWDDAMAVLDRFIIAKPDEAAAHAWWGIVSATSGKDMDRGERELKYYLANALPETTPQSYANVHYRLGQIYEKTGRKDLARASYQESLKFNPAHPEAKKALELLKQRTGAKRRGRTTSSHARRRPRSRAKAGRRHGAS